MAKSLRAMARRREAVFGTFVAEFGSPGMGRIAPASLGMVVGSPEQGLDMIKAGFTLIAYSGDAWLLCNALRAGIDAMRAGLRTTPRRRATEGRGKR